MSASTPLFVVLGPQRSGTTWIYEYLRALGSVGTTRELKEIRFFDEHFERGFDWYTSSFTTVAGPRVDVSSTYIDSAAARRNIARCGVAGVVICYRDPLERIRSLHNHRVLQHGAPRGFREAWQSDATYLSGSLYAANLALWQATLPSERILVLDFETLRHDPSRYAAQLCDFIGVPCSDAALPSGKVNAARPPDGAPLSNRVARLKRLARRAGLGRAVNALKHSPLRRLVTGERGTGDRRGAGTSTPIRIPEEELDEFLAYIAADHERFLERHGPALGSTRGERPARTASTA